MTFAALPIVCPAPAARRLHVVVGMRTDAEFYELALAFPTALLLLVLGRRPEVGYRAVSRTVKRAERRIDIVLEPVDADEIHWVFECQGYSDPQAERRLFLEAVMLADEEQLWGRVRTAMIYTRRVYARASLPSCLGPGGTVGLEPVRVVLEEIPPEELLRLGPECFPLLPLTRVTRETLVDRLPAWWGTVKQAPEVDPAQADRLREQFSGFLAARFPSDKLEEINKALGVTMALEDTQAGQDLIQIGVERGLEKGRCEGLRDSLLQTLQTRFGELPAGLLAELQRVDDPERLRRLHRTSLVAADLDAFQSELA